MKLKVFSPINIILEQEIKKIDLEALDGYVCLLPKHVDFICAFPPNIIQFETLDSKTNYMACNHGILVKQGKDIFVSVQKAILGNNLTTLTHAIQTEFKQEEEERKELNAVMAKLESGLTRGFVELQTQGK